jgi:hypothetical protein
MINTILNILAAGLSIWEHKEVNKYREKFMRLRKEIYEEENKPQDKYDAAVLDNLYFELYILGEAFSSEVRKTDAKNIGRQGGPSLSLFQV